MKIKFLITKIKDYGIAKNDNILCGTNDWVWDSIWWLSLPVFKPSSSYPSSLKYFIQVLTQVNSIMSRRSISLKPNFINASNICQTG